ncbi:hypothetical protein JCM17846_08710 [Iodidimonas nitroreducens]|uniref:Uncharacterized protein n=1 Tax=Iodidimonas nitroreducens TaxID=1236968 RepID=A0A5A7N7Z0_9PROT|nr:hypothetical protein [Iodidimonas nitroreducens]GAK32392.1 hypothetical protein AQ1_00256 [alpha proteobacterium Q-1]GER03189.1 hypothetical protein JCM17846_08710 [Iodidimonas nitroreducens]
MTFVKKILPWLLTVFIAFVFVQSLAFKFTGAPEPVYIFKTIEGWAQSSLGLSGLFAPGGIFSQQIVGVAELIASLLLLAGAALGGLKGQGRAAKTHAVGALLALGVISGAIFFHLFTPLGIVVGSEADQIASDGGSLFIMALLVWISSAALLFFHRDMIKSR